MQTNIKTAIQQIFNKQGLDKIQETEKLIQKHLGLSFLKKHIQQIYINNKTIIIKTKSIEAKTELNLRIKKLNTKNPTKIK